MDNPTHSYIPTFNMSEKIDELTKALSLAQGVLENVQKDSKGYGYTYSSLASCLDTIKQPLLDNGLAITQVMGNHNKELTLVTYLMHISGQWIKSTIPILTPPPEKNNNNNNKYAKSPMQELGSSISYARRYALTAIIGLAQADDDGTNKDNKTPPPKNPIEDRSNLVSQITHLCEEQGIITKAFGDFHKLREKNTIELSKVVENFEALAMEYMTFSKGDDDE